MAGYELAQLNMGRILAPLDTPTMAGFTGALDEINALADRAPGFVWRLQTEDGDATAIRAFDDDMLLLNMSVWTSIEALAEFVYRSDHRAVMVQRRKWFERMDEAFTVLWWVPAGHRPSTLEAKDRLEHLRRHGPTATAFTFRTPFPAPDAEATLPAPTDDLWNCPA
jgi:hypothetical protein